MKHLKVILFSAMIFCSMGAFGQSQTGELDRFKDESLVQYNNIQLFPNPSIDYLNIRIDNYNMKETKLVVYNIIGNIVKVDTEELGEGQFRIKVEDFVPGYYIVRISDEQGFFEEAYKFLKR